MRFYLIASCSSRRRRGERSRRLRRGGVIVETEHGLSTAVQALLSEAGSTRYRARDLRRTNKACWDWIAKDHLAPSHDLTAPFSDFAVVAKGIAISSSYADQFESYIVRVDDQDDVIRPDKQ